VKSTPDTIGPAEPPEVLDGHCQDMDPARKTNRRLVQHQQGTSLDAYSPAADIAALQMDVGVLAGQTSAKGSGWRPVTV
jgi:hypothetical protein